MEKENTFWNTEAFYRWFRIPFSLTLATSISSSNFNENLCADCLPVPSPAQLHGSPFSAGPQQAVFTSWLLQLPVTGFSECREGRRREGSEQFLSTPRVTKSSQFAWNFPVLAQSPIPGNPSVPGTLVHPATPPTPPYWGTTSLSACILLRPQLSSGDHMLPCDVSPWVLVTAFPYLTFLICSWNLGATLPFVHPLNPAHTLTFLSWTFLGELSRVNSSSVITMKEATLRTLFRSRTPSPLHPLSEASLTLDMPLPSAWTWQHLFACYLFVGRDCARYSSRHLAQGWTLCPVTGWQVGFCPAALTLAPLFILQVWLGWDVFFQSPDVAPNKDMNEILKGSTDGSGQNNGPPKVSHPHANLWKCWTLWQSKIN